MRKFANSAAAGGTEIAFCCKVVSLSSFPLAIYERDGRFRLHANDTDSSWPGTIST